MNRFHTQLAQEFQLTLKLDCLTQKTILKISLVLYTMEALKFKPGLCANNAGAYLNDFI